MTKELYRYAFTADVPIEEVEASLLLAVLATESLHGEAQTRLDAAHYLDPASGPICTPSGVLNHICHEVGVRELIRDGYLCPLVTVAGRAKVDTGALKVKAGEFVAADAEALMDQDKLVAAACLEIAQHSANRQATLIFATGVRHGQHIAEVLARVHGLECGFVSGQTPPPERGCLLDRFRLGRLKYLVNVNVLTTGLPLGGELPPLSLHEPGFLPLGVDLPEQSRIKGCMRRAPVGAGPQSLGGHLRCEPSGRGGPSSDGTTAECPPPRSSRSLGGGRRCTGSWSWLRFRG